MSVDGGDLVAATSILLAVCLIAALTLAAMCRLLVRRNVTGNGVAGVASEVARLHRRSIDEIQFHQQCTTPQWRDPVEADPVESSNGPMPTNGGPTAAADGITTTETTTTVADTTSTNGVYTTPAQSTSKQTSRSVNGLSPHQNIIRKWAAFLFLSKPFKMLYY